MTILAANHFAEGVVGTVIRSRQPLGIEILQAIDGNTFAARIEVSLTMGERARAGHPHIMAPTAKVATAEKRYAFWISARDVKIVFHGSGKRKGPNFTQRGQQFQAHIGKPITTDAAIQVRSGDVVTHITGNPSRHLARAVRPAAADPQFPPEEAGGPPASTRW